MNTAPASPSPALDDRLDEARRSEMQRAMRALLRYPLLVADGPHAEAFILVRRHAEPLRNWLAHHAHWGLQVTSELARLRKTPPDTSDGTRPARDGRTGIPFTRTRYLLFCLALAALERSDRQTTLGQLARSMQDDFQADPVLAACGWSFDLTHAERRRDLVQVIRFLVEQHLLRRVQGDEEVFIHDATGDALYNIHRRALSVMLTVQRGPSMVAADSFDERLAAIVEEPVPDSPEGLNRQIRTRLIRRFLDDPVLYYDDLDPKERAYLESQRVFMLRQVEEATGLVAEVRREGIALLDPRGDLTDLGLPEEGTEGHLTLLLAEHLAEALRRDETAETGFAALCEVTAGLIREHHRHWRKDVLEPGAERHLTHSTLERLAALRLVAFFEQGGTISPLPAIARYALVWKELPGDDAPPDALL